ncbi:TadE/TadG family type IV pilus assembly protein [Beutenbergia cavernae]|uniref:TadE/TadG family type IV pilus assembly protein n=1 Tax=Beutenbergia cavernae TaxID=84757 RepID=UPI001FDFACFA|nr:TadE/TadG family type IV pilus assembly protein [Beutenbergia cavernae]
MDFALVSVLVVVLALGVIQLALVLHVRTTLIDCAAEGARLAALHDGELDDGVARTEALIAGSLSPTYAQDVTARTSDDGGVATVEVDVTAPLPVLGLLGPGGVVTVTGRAVQEQ